MENNTLHVVVAVVFVGLLLLLVDPFMLFMPPMAVMVALLLAAIVACVWVGFVMFEQVGDEREAVHRMNAGRAAYLSGVGVLLLALIVQGLSHAIDPWVVGALITMVLAKLFTRLYLGRYR